MDIERAVWRQFKERDVVVLGLNRGQSANTVLSLMDQLHLTFPVLLDPTAKVYKMYAGGGSPKFSPFPRDIIVDPEGKILYYSKAYHPKAMIDVIEKYLNATGVEASDVHRHNPKGFELYQNYPNPFNPTTTIEFSLSQPDNVLLAVYNVVGRRVATLIDGPVNAGFHQVKFDTGALHSGVYLYEIRVGQHSRIRKMNLIK